MKPVGQRVSVLGSRPVCGSRVFAFEMHDSGGLDWNDSRGKIVGFVWVRRAWAVTVMRVLCQQLRGLTKMPVCPQGDGPQTGLQMSLRADRG